MAEFSSYNLATININNITNATKIDALRTLIRTMELDIVFLQEVENEQLSLPGFNVF
jgi:exonuclease III